ncbi:F-box protein At2g27310-like [Juglans microcarpa x Juglans regia]|uniref:F-box protein At2g27310-like n=1 Tax=Juglans microcarpa x Juglans regia TaxID=2249226 RepID=UPI001B7EF1C4|nr:F-box protein At2g27310-like [Juglans microcarpa x Juglans regia]
MAFSSSSSSTTTPLTTVDHGGAIGISAVHPDIIQTHILTRLDGPSLASAACASSHLHELSTEEKLWWDICASTWPSINHPRVRHVISSFPAGHRSFFSDSFPAIHHSSPPKDTDRPFLPSELISAVDVHYENELIFSKVQETRTETETAGWFLCTPFRVELIDQKESVRTQIRQVGEEKAWLKQLEENLKLSWIVIDPTRKRAVNVSSGRPVSVQRHWFTGDIQLRYATIMAGEKSDFVQCAVVVTCGGKVGGEIQLREVSMLLEDMERKHVKGRESLVILKAAMESGKRKKERRGEGKERFEAYLEMMKVRSERKQRRERAVDMAFILTGITIFVAFCSYLCFR